MKEGMEMKMPLVAFPIPKAIALDGSTTHRLNAHTMKFLSGPVYRLHIVPLGG